MNKRIFCGIMIVLVLLVSGAAASGTGFSYRGGISWETSPAQMLVTEGAAEGTYNRQDMGGYTFYYLKAQDVYYVFRGEMLVQAYTLLSAGAYDAQVQQLTTRYGTPVPMAADTLPGLLNALLPGSVNNGEITAYTGWILSDGTLAAVFTIGSQTCTAYFHQQRITGV